MASDSEPPVKLRFKPSARLQRFLGEELIADPNVAILEFVKNSYDAGASDVLVRFGLSGEPSTLLIADDGVGMNLEEFESNWMHPGFSTKGLRSSPKKPLKGASSAERREASRVPVGEKGIGRLAAGRLGARLDVFTRKFTNQPWLHVAFDWSAFNDMNSPLDEIDVPYDFETSPEDAPFSSGTIVLISDLSLKWYERIRGRKLRGRKTTRLGRLKQDFGFLVRPLAPQGEKFAIRLESDMVRDADDVGTVTPTSAAADVDYRYKFSISVQNGLPVVERSIHRGAEAAKLAARPTHEALEPLKIDSDVAAEFDRPEQLSCGPIEGEFFYTPPPAFKRAREVDESPVGVLVYRDKVLVEPYGLNDNDWLGARARKAQRQGHAAIQPDTFFGHVLISRKNNPLLRDQTNRLGLLDTPESETFIDHVRAEFRHFEGLMYDEVFLTRWEGNKELEARRNAQESQERVSILLKSLAHSLRQPLQGLGFELVAITELSKRPDLPPGLSEVLKGIAERSGQHIALAEELIGPLVTRTVPEFSRVATSDLVDRAVQQVSLLAEGSNAELLIDSVVDVPVNVPADLVVQALAALIHNGIEAPRPDGRQASVRLGARQVGDHVEITITDNGLGIDGPSEDVDQIKSTKGRPATGLKNANSSILAARGRLVPRDSDSSGTTFEVWLPTRTDGIKK